MGIVSGATLQQLFDVPGLPPAADPRTPDIAVAPNVGVTYTGSNKKLAEHGGFSHVDTNVMKALGLDPAQLDGVRIEGTPVLPDVKF
jgi:hypothetical protein